MHGCQTHEFMEIYYQKVYLLAHPVWGYELTHKFDDNAEI